MHPQPRLKHYAQVALTTVFLTMVTWVWFKAKMMVAFLPLWIGFETIYRIKVRSEIRCSYCGFDPFLYLADTARARSEIEAHWRKKFEAKGIPYPEPEHGGPRLDSGVSGP